MGALIACQNESKMSEGGGALEARVKKLEETNAKYAEALDFLQKVYGQQKQQQVQQEREEPAPDAMFAVDITESVKAGFAEGPAAGAPVTIVAAEDFACPYCERVSTTLDELVKEYDGKVRVVFKNMVVHPQVMNAHLAGCAAAKQGKFPEFKREFWEKGFKARKMDDANIETIVKSIKGINVDAWKKDKDSAECKQLVQNDMNELQKFKVNSTPTLFVNGTHVGGALPKEAFKQMIDEKLKTAQGADHYEKVVMATGEKQFRSKMDPKPN